jgi:carbon monoxide dehydrogenase subunit G
MQFSSKEDIDAPIDQVFVLLTDFDGFERAALRRGAEVQRVDDLEEPGPGMAWDMAFMLRGKLRKMRLTMTEFDGPNQMTFEGVSPGLDGTLKVELLSMSRTRTRMGFEIELEAKNLSARLVLQSLKLGRNNLNKRMHLRVADFASDLEKRYRRKA